MKVLFLLILVLGMFFLYSLLYYQKEMYDPYGIKFVWGKIGSGKSTLVCKIALRVFNGLNPYFKKVYCNTKEVPNTYYFNLNELIKLNEKVDDDNYFVPFDPESIVVFDEGSLAFNNRDFKTFSKYLQYLFRKCRHHKLYCIVLSQNFDVDKTIRSLASDMSTLHKYFNCISVEKPLYMDVGLKETSDGVVPGDLYTSGGLFSWRFAFIPKYVAFFDSYETNATSKGNFKFTYFAPSQAVTDRSAVAFVVEKAFFRFYSKLARTRVFGALVRCRFFAKKRHGASASEEENTL